MTIRYDDNRVKRPHAEHEYTNDDILELEKCSQDINYFIKYVKIISPDRGEEYFQPYEYQKKLLKILGKERFVISLQSRQSGKTTVVGVYALWYALFNSNKTIGIVSNKESSAKMILARIKNIYKSLPAWLKPGVEEFSKMFVTFDNNSRIIISATSEDAFRGETINLLIMDEFAFVPKNQAREFWASNYPTISASTESKIVIISTPNGMFNLFHELYHNAEHGRNSFYSMKVSWQEVPGRDNEWAREQLRNLGKVKFAQEFACVTGDTIITIKDDLTNKIYNISIQDFFENFLP